MVYEAKLLNFQHLPETPYNAFRQPQYIHTFYHLSKLNYFLPFLLPFNSFFVSITYLITILNTFYIEVGSERSIFACRVSSKFLYQKCFPMWRTHKANRRRTEMGAVSLSWKKRPAVQWLGSFFWKRYRKTPSLSVNSKPRVFDNSWLK